MDLDELIAKKERRRMKRLGRLSSEMDSDEGSRRPGRRRKEDVEDFAGGKKRGRPKKNDMEVYNGRDTTEKKKKLNLFYV